MSREYDYGYYPKECGCNRKDCGYYPKDCGCYRNDCGGYQKNYGGCQNNCQNSCQNNCQSNCQSNCRTNCDCCGCQTNSCQCRQPWTPIQPITVPWTPIQPITTPWTPIQPITTPWTPIQPITTPMADIQAVPIEVNSTVFVDSLQQYNPGANSLARFTTVCNGNYYYNIYNDQTGASKRVVVQNGGSCPIDLYINSGYVGLISPGQTWASQKDNIYLVTVASKIVLENGTGCAGCVNNGVNTCMLVYWVELEA